MAALNWSRPNRGAASTSTSTAPSASSSSATEWARFEALDNRHISRTDLTVDQAGWSAVTAVLGEAMARVAEIEAEAAKRLRANGEPGTRARVEILHSQLAGEGG